MIQSRPHASLLPMISILLLLWLNSFSFCIYSFMAALELRWFHSTSPLSSKALAPSFYWFWKSLSHVWFFATPRTICSSPGQNTGVGSLSLLRGIFATQGLNRGLPNCRQFLYQLRHKGSPSIDCWGPRALSTMAASELCYIQPTSLHFLSKANYPDVPVSVYGSWLKMESASHSFPSIVPACFQVYRLPHHIQPFSFLFPFSLSLELGSTLPCRLMAKTLPGHLSPAPTFFLFCFQSF